MIYILKQINVNIFVTVVSNAGYEAKFWHKMKDEF